MKVISPSASIIDYTGMSLLEKIELAGRLCYKSEEKITPGSAAAFVKNTAAAGHNSVLEMGHLVFPGVKISERELAEFLLTKPKYLHWTEDSGYLTVSGSPRAIRDLYRAYPECEVVHCLYFGMLRKYPELALDQYVTSDDWFEAVEEFGWPEDEHNYVGVRFIIGRHTSHELVRHRPMGVLQESQRYCNYSLGKFGKEVTFIKPAGIPLGTDEQREWSDAMKLAEASYFRLINSRLVAPQVARTVLPNSTKTEVIVYCNLVQWKHIFYMRISPACDPSMLEVMIPLEEEFERRGC
jgi:thymidylate synthase (FAD)